MFRTVVSRLYLLILAGSFILVTPLNAQINEHEIPDVKSRAMERFKAEEYDLAEADFRLLMEQFSRDPMYRYYTGICLVEQNQDLEEAMELLQFASTRGVPEDVYYYLGEASRKMYDFEKARQYYLDFDQEAPRSMTRELDSKFLIHSINKAIQFTSTYNPYEVLNVTFLNLNDPEQYGQIRMKGGQLVTKPDPFFAGDESDQDLNSLMFMPDNVSRGQTVYFSGLERNGKDGFQIMKAKKGNAGKWVGIEAVDGLNSERDEILPYFDPVGRDIYFASDGREGLGGYDLYRSHYDEDNKEWSEPVHLGFPVNSTMDDYLLLPGTDLGMVIFFSARQANDTAVTVYRVQLSEPKQSLASKTPRELREIANLDNVASTAMREYEALAMKETRPARSPEPKSTAGDDQKQESEIPPSSSADHAQQELIAAALGRQRVSDSLIELASAARIRVRDSDDPNDRWLYQKQIMVWEKRAAEEQEAADAYFTQIAKKEETVLPGSIEKDTVINEMTVYRFVEQDSISSKAREVFSGNDQQASESERKGPQQSSEKTVDATRENLPDSPGKNEVKERQVGKAAGTARKSFKLLDRSPYSMKNPIPVDVEIPDGVFYRIQLGVFSREIDPDTYGGLSPISGESVPGKALTRYYAGEFTSYEKARDALDIVRSRGYQDAFIVAWYNRGRMSVEKARKLEK